MSPLVFYFQIVLYTSISKFHVTCRFNLNLPIKLDVKSAPSLSKGSSGEFICIYIYIYMYICIQIYIKKYTYTYIVLTERSITACIMTFVMASIMTSIIMIFTNDMRVAECAQQRAQRRALQCAAVLAKVFATAIVFLKGQRFND